MHAREQLQDGDDRRDLRKPDTDHPLDRLGLAFRDLQLEAGAYSNPSYGLELR